MYICKLLINGHQFGEVQVSEPDEAEARQKFLEQIEGLEEREAIRAETLLEFITHFHYVREGN